MDEIELTSSDMEDHSENLSQIHGRPPLHFGPTNRNKAQNALTVLNVKPGVLASPENTSDGPLFTICPQKASWYSYQSGFPVDI